MVQCENECNIVRVASDGNGYAPIISDSFDHSSLKSRTYINYTTPKCHDEIG